MRFTNGTLAGSTIEGMPSLRLRLLDFLLKRCLRKALLRFIFPLPVTVKVFLALECVFNLGIRFKNLDGKGICFYFFFQFYFKKYLSFSPFCPAFC